MNLPCSTQGRDLWFSKDYYDQLEAIALCHTCPVIDSCRELSAGEVHGVWGGVLVGGTKKTKMPIVCDNPECGKEFVPANSRVRFCGGRCRDRADRIRRTARDRQQRAEESPVAA